MMKICLVFLVLTCLAVWGLAAEQPGRTAADMAAIAKARRLQTELPLGGREKAGQPFEFDISYSGGVGNTPAWAKTLLWIAISVFFLVLLYCVAANLRLGKRGETDFAPPRPDAAVAVVRLETARLDADAIAAAGDYVEAMHRLLLQAIDESRRLRGVAFAHSLTSREILGSDCLAAPAREALADIVARVEISYFGRRLPGPDEYAACRESFRRFGQALAGGGEQL